MTTIYQATSVSHYSPSTEAYTKCSNITFNKTGLQCLSVTTMITTEGVTPLLETVSCQK